MTAPATMALYIFRHHHCGCRGLSRRTIAEAGGGVHGARVVVRGGDELPVPERMIGKGRRGPGG